MKKIYLMALMAITVLVSSAQQKFSVSNIPGITANFNNLQTAINTVPAGSIIHVFPSAISYGEITINKPLTIYGTGYFLDENTAPNTSHNKTGVVVHNIIINQGGSGTFIEGLEIKNNPTWYNDLAVLNNTSNVVISRCLFTMGNPHINSFVNPFKTVNCTVRNCYFDMGGLPLQGMPVLFLRQPGNIENSTANTNLNLRFIGNIMNYYQGAFTATTGQYQTLNYPNPSINDDVQFTNNTILTSIGCQSDMNGQFGDYIYNNNIIYITYNPYTSGGCNSAPYSPNRAFNLNRTCTNNVSNFPNLFPTWASGNNLSNVPIAQLFSNSTATTDGQWKLLSSSPAMTYGPGGTQVGAFGGDYPYQLSGIPNIPNVYNMAVTPMSGNPNQLKLTIKGKSSY